MASRGIKLRFRTAFFVAGAFSLLLTAYFAISYLTIKQSLIERSDQEVYSQLDSILTHTTFGSSEGDLNTLFSHFGSTGEARIGFIIRRSSGQPLSSAIGPVVIRSLLDSQRFYPNEVPMNISSGPSTIRILQRSGNQLTITAGINTITFDEVFDAMLRTYFILLLSGIIISFIIAVGTAHLALKPLKILVSSAKQIRNQDATSPLILPTNTPILEMNDLASVINDVLIERDQNIEGLKNFTADAAHELRTPLTILKGELEVDLRTKQLSSVERDGLKSNLEEVHRLIKIVEDLLILARAEQPSQGQYTDEEWKLSELMDEILTRLDPMIKEKNIVITQEYLLNPPLLLPKSDVERIIYNILLNAVQYSSENQTIDITTVSSGDRVMLSIRDHGIGMTAVEAQHVFKRFWRADKARSRSSGGVGLGLAIAKTYADKLGLQLHCSSEQGKGTEMTCIMPFAS